MKRVGAISAILLALAVPAFSQINLGGNVGVSKPASSQRLPVAPTDQFITVTYPWSSLPAATDAGWFVQQSTAAGVTIAAGAPMLFLTPATANRRLLLSEFATAGFVMPAYTSVTSDGEVTLAVPIYDLQSIGAGTTGYFQLAYGDTTNFVVNKKPASGFGIIVTGSTNANNAYAQAATITGYVSSGVDTTYTPLQLTSVAGTGPIKVFIHADAAGGSVQFWLNDILRATISSPVRSTDGGCNTSIIVNGAAGMGVMGIGPLTVQRAWP